MDDRASAPPPAPHRTRHCPGPGPGRCCLAGQPEASQILLVITFAACLPRGKFCRLLTLTGTAWFVVAGVSRVSVDTDARLRLLSAPGLRCRCLVGVINGISSGLRADVLLHGLGGGAPWRAQTRRS